MRPEEPDPEAVPRIKQVQVFISSALKELAEYRQAAVEVCQSLHLTTFLERSAPRYPEQSLAALQQADIFVGIYGESYGFIPSGSETSILEMEYDRAMELGLPALIYLQDWTGPTDRLKKFAAKLMAEHAVRPLHDVTGFRELLLRDLARLTGSAGPALTTPEPSAESPPATAPRLRGVNLQMLADAALETDEDDLLNFCTYADAIAGLIDHPDTRTPLTLAINGPWGAGKSTLGRMISRRLERKPAAGGTRPHVTCWFNSWMHDDATDLAAAFASQVASSAEKARPFWRRLISPLPTSMNSPGRRLRRHFFGSLLIALAAFLISLYLVPKNGGPLLLDEKLKPFFESLHPGDDILFAISVGTLTLFLIRWLSAAARSVSEFVSDPKAAADSGSMDRVRDQLAKLIHQATPPGSRFVVFIDDLERCRPPRSVDVLEVVNQLLNHEGIVTVIMADVPAVAAAVEVKYEQLAKIYRPASENPSRNVGSYGRLYLQKIVQIQFDLPTLRSERIVNLIRAVAQPKSGADAATAQRHTRRIFTWLGRVFSTGLAQQSWHPGFAWGELWRHAARQRIPARICIALALVFFSPLIFLSHAAARTFYFDTRSRLASTRTTRTIIALRSIRFASVLTYASGILLLSLDALHPGLGLGWQPPDADSLWLSRLALILILASAMATAVCAAIEARLQWRFNLRALTTARKLARERILSGTENLDEIQRELRRSSGLEEGDQLLLQERLYLLVTSESDLFGEAQNEILTHLPALPRSAKRLLNSLRLHFYVAYQLKVLDETITPAHLGKWIVLRDRWPDLAQALMGSPASMDEIEKADDAQWSERIKLLANGLEADAELKSFFREGAQLGSVLSSLVRLEPANARK